MKSEVKGNSDDPVWSDALSRLSLILCFGESEEQGDRLATDQEPCDKRGLAR
jgi:hypothetical protein